MICSEDDMVNFDPDEKTRVPFEVLLVPNETVAQIALVTFTVSVAPLLTQTMSFDVGGPPGMSLQFMDVEIQKVVADTFMLQQIETRITTNAVLSKDLVFIER